MIMVNNISIILLYQLYLMNEKCLDKSEKYSRKKQL